jgi:hypothetical protein
MYECPLFGVEGEAHVWLRSGLRSGLMLLPFLFIFFVACRGLVLDSE